MIISDRERQAPLKVEEAEVTHLARYDFALNFLNKNLVVLDAPCGSGYGSAHMSKGVKAVYGIDCFSGAIDHAREFFDRENTRFVVGDMQDMQDNFKDDFFNVIVSFEGIEHIGKQVQFLKESRRVLKKDGKLIISTPRKPQGNPFHTVEFSYKEFIDFLSKYFEIEKVFGQTYVDFFELTEKNMPKEDVRLNFIVICKNVK
ncbi:MAG TPA: class I SAM-dependent methyltransferase [Candidatus Pacearchaeota archaeon]|nr:class I SAM-dependent methyltransferase [Candidatus Pacearchaeota archaeon]